MANVDGWISGQGLREDLIGAYNKAKQIPGAINSWGKSLLKEPVTPAAPTESVQPSPSGRPITGPTRGEVPMEGLGAAALTAGTAMVPWKPTPGAAQGPVISGPALGPTEQTLRADRGGPKLSAEQAAQARAPQYTNTEKVPEVKAPGKVAKARGLLGSAARLATPVVGMMGAADAIQNGPQDADYRIGDSISSVIPNYGKSAQGLRDTVGSIGAAASNVTRRIGNAFDPSPIWGGQANLGDKLVGGAADIARGDPLGTTQFEPNKPALRAAPVQTAQTGSIATTAQPAKPAEEAGLDFSGPKDSYGMPPLPKNATARQAREWLAASNSMAELKAQHRSRPQPGEGLRGGDVTAPLRALYEGKKGNERGVGALAALGSYGALTRLNQNQTEVGLKRADQDIAVQGKNAELGLRDDANTIAAAKVALDARQSDRTFNNTVQQQNRAFDAKGADKEIESYALEKVGSQGTMEKSDTYKNRVAAAKSQYEGRMRYGVSNRKDGKRFEDMNGTERTQLHDAIKFQDKVIDARGSLRQNFKDFFGNKRVDTKDPYSFMPARNVAADMDSDGTIRIKTVNGNTITVGKAAGGDFNLFTPNEAIDADMMALMKPQIDELKRQQKGK